MARGRKTNSEDGVKADKSVPLKVTPDTKEKLEILAEIKTGGSVNKFVTELIDAAIKANAAILEKALKSRRAYKTSMDNLIAVAQDSETEGGKVKPVKPKKPAKKKTPPADATATTTEGNDAGEIS